MLIWTTCKDADYQPASDRMGVISTKIVSEVRMRVKQRLSMESGSLISHLIDGFRTLTMRWHCLEEVLIEG